MELENTATEVVEAETEQDVADPAESNEEGSNYEEVAEPQSEEVTEQSHEDNAKFQEYRHRMEEAERRAEELQRQIDSMEASEKVRNEVYAEYLDDDEDVDIDAIIADAYGISSAEVKARIEEKAELERYKAENEQLKAEREAILQKEQEARENEALTNQLAEVNKIDPSIKSVYDFETTFEGLSHTPSDYLEKGLTLTETYWALKAEKDAHKRTPPPEVGGVKNEQTEKPYFSRDDVMAMTSEERMKHWKEIRAAQQSGKW